MEKAAAKEKALRAEQEQMRLRKIAAIKAAKAFAEKERMLKMRLAKANAEMGMKNLGANTSYMTRKVASVAKAKAM